MTETESGDLHEKPNSHLRPLDRAEGRYTTAVKNDPKDPSEVAHYESVHEPNVAEQIDKREEVFADKLSQLIKQSNSNLVVVSLKILQWHDSQLERARQEGAGMVLEAITGEFIKPCKNRQARDVGLAFAIGLSHRINGVRDMSHAARKFNCSVALISHYKRFWDNLLPPGVRVYGKTAQACTAYVRARLISYGYRTRNTTDNNTTAANST